MDHFTVTNIQKRHVNYGLQSLKGFIWVSTTGVIKGDTSGLDYRSYEAASATGTAKTWNPL